MANIFEVYKEQKRLEALKGGNDFKELTEKVNKVVKQVLERTEAIPKEKAEEIFSKYNVLEITFALGEMWVCSKSKKLKQTYKADGINLDVINRFLQAYYAKNIFVGQVFVFDFNAGTIQILFFTDEVKKKIRKKKTKKLLKDLKKAFPACKVKIAKYKNYDIGLELHYKV